MQSTVTNKYTATASDLAIKTTKEALENNGFKVIVVDNLDQARQEVFKIIPKGAEVLTNTSLTLDTAGISKEVNESGNYVSVRGKFMPLSGKPEKAVEMKRIGSGADYSLGSVHAITEDGRVLVASASGSNLAGYAYGASNIIWVVGSQKIVKDLNEGLERIEKNSLPLEDERAQKAYGIHSALKKILIYREENTERVTIILVKESVGF